MPDETEWLEFKENRAEPDDIGEYLSAISNSAALHGRDMGFIVWGVRDGTREIVGTDFEPRRRKIGNGDLEPWLAFHLKQLPQNEELGQALRRETRVYPEVAVRELVANALIHQDFHLTGTGPMVEIFQESVDERHARIGNLDAVLGCVA